MAEDGVFESDSVGTEDPPSHAGHVQCITDVVEFAEGDLFWGELAFVLPSTEVQRDQSPSLHGDHHLDELLLGQLERPDRSSELLPLQAVGQGRLVTRPG